MQYRLLDASEWDKLNAIVDSKFIPSPDVASAAVAVDDDGNLTGVLFLQLALHMEPLILRSPKVSFQALHDVLYNAVSADKGLRMYCFSTSEIVDHMASHVGMQALPGKTFVQEVK